MSSSLSSKARSGALWSGIDALGSRFIQFGVGIVLARLLTPSEFGLLAMLTVFIAVAQAISDGGFATAIVQKKEVSELECSSVLYANFIVSAILTLLCYAAAPLIASFYSEPKLVDLSRGLSWILLIDASSRIQRALLTRDLNFKTQAKVTTISGIISGFVGISLAYLGSGVWSLVAQQLTASVVRAIVYWRLCAWRPTTGLSILALIPLFGFGSKMLASNVLQQIFLNLYELVIGKMFDPTTLGYYSRAARLQSLPTSTLSAISSRVTLPLFSQIQGETARLRSAIKRVLQLTTYVSAPIMFFLAASADNFIPVLLTEKWSACIPYFQLLCVFGLVQPLHAINLHALAASGRSDVYLTLEIIKKLLVIIVLALTYRYGVMAIIVGRLCLEFLSTFINNYYVAREIGYGNLRQIIDICPQLSVAGVIGCGIYAIGYLLNLQPIWELCIQYLFGLISYLSISLAINIAGADEAIGFIKPILNRVLITTQKR